MMYTGEGISGFFFGFVGVFIFAVFAIVVVANIKNISRINKINQNQKREEQAEQDKISKHYFVREEVAPTRFCPFCNTKIDPAKARLCLVCRKDYICPTCKKCRNYDQHKGI